MGMIIILLLVIAALVTTLTIVLTKKPQSGAECAECAKCDKCNYKKNYCLNTGHALFTDGTIFSPNLAYKAVLHSDGNFIIYKNSDNSAIWSLGIRDKGPSYLHMQLDGNFVAYKISDRVPYWSTGTSGPGTSNNFVYLDNEGILNVGDETRVAWKSRN
jgi:hypothetical protein